MEPAAVTVLRLPDDASNSLGTPGEILELFRRAPDGLTRTEAARLAGLSRTAVNQRVDRLLRHRLILPVGSDLRTGGRPADRFRLNPRFGCLLIADTGVTGMRVALCDMMGEVKEERYEALDINEGPTMILARIEQRFRSLLRAGDASHVSVRGIGLNVPGPVDIETGRVINPPIMAGWHDFDIPGYFLSRYKCPVVVEKDGTAMAFGEHRRIHPTKQNLVFMKLGTGIGTGIVVAGAPYRGMNGAAGDVGHIPLSVPGSQAPQQCRCGNVGCIEAYASGWALMRDLREAGLSVSGVDDVVSLTRDGSAEAVRLVRRAALIFGTAVSDIVGILNPGVVAIGGQLAAIGDLLFAGIREVVYRRALPLATRDLQILPSGLHERLEFWAWLNC